ncbi:MAG: glutamine amidotransferase [Planctomycetaceae bacterium]
MPGPSILYCGDTTLDSAAAYLAGLITRAGWNWSYLPSHLPLTSSHLMDDLQLVIFSDYPAQQASIELQQQIVSRVEQGCGLLMLGGWESYFGCGGNWNDTPIGEVLPVEIADSDDRQNVDQPVFIRPHQPHPLTDPFPWNTRPPLIGGYNRFTPKPDGELLLVADRYQAVRQDGPGRQTIELSPLWSDPLLVIGRHGTGITAAMATDIAPHWVGPLVDWGDSRVSAQAPDAPAIEVGNLYADFFTELLRYVGRLH